MAQNSPGSRGKYRQAAFFILFIGLAVWGGWGLARMGQDRSRAKAEAEADAISGRGEVIPSAPDREAKPVVPEPVTAPGGTPVVPDPAVPVVPVAREPIAVDPRVAIGIEPDGISPAVVPAVVVVAPGTLRIKTVPLAEVRITDKTGSRPAGLADASGRLTVTDLQPGSYALETVHKDYEPDAVPQAVEVDSGATRDVTLSPTPRPGSLIVLADEGITVFFGDTRAGAGAVMLGKVPSNRPVKLRLVAKDRPDREETVTLAPREHRLLDLRTAVVKPAEPVGGSGEETKPAPVAEVAGPAVKVLSISAEGSLVALSTDPESKDFPAKTGDRATLVAGTLKVGVSCVRVVPGGVALFRFEGPASALKEDTKAVLTPVAPEPAEAPEPKKAL